MFKAAILRIEHLHQKAAQNAARERVKVEAFSLWLAENPEDELRPQVERLLESARHESERLSDDVEAFGLVLDDILNDRSEELELLHGNSEGSGQ